MPINLTSNLLPLGAFPLLEDIYLKGGYQVVADITARDAIAASSRKEGMLVWVQSTSVLYRLAAGNTWVVFGNTVQEEGSTTSSTVTTFNFTGGGVTASGSGSTATINIPGSTVQEEGSTTSSTVTTFNFTGGGVTASGSGSTATINIPGSTVQEEGSNTSTTVTTFNFVGGGVTASGSGSTATITIPEKIAGPGPSTDNAIPTWNGTTGLALNDSVIRINPAGTITSSTALTLTTSLAGALINIKAGDASTTGDGGQSKLYAGAGGSASGDGGFIDIRAGNVVAASGTGGRVDIFAGAGGGTTGDGGNINLKPGGKSSGNQGVINLTPPTSGNAPELRFLENEANGTNYFGLKAAASMAADTTYTLPNAYPASNGYVLSSLTDGGLSWVSRVEGPGSSTDNLVATWNSTGGTLLRNTSNVRISAGTITSHDLLLTLTTVSNNPARSILVEPGVATGTNINGAGITLRGGYPTGTGTPGDITIEGADKNTGTDGSHILLRGGRGNSDTTDGVIKIATTNSDNRATRLQFVAEDGDTVSIKAPATIGTSYVLTLPTDQGASSTFLRNNGSGTLSWVAAVTGPGSSTDNAIVTWNSTTGTVLRNNAVTLSSQTIEAASGDLIVGGAAATTATKGVTTVRKVTSILTANTTLTNGSIALVDVTGASRTFTLPDPAVSAGQSIQIISTAASANQIRVAVPNTTDYLNGLSYADDYLDWVYVAATNVGTTLLCTCAGGTSGWYVVAIDGSSVNISTSPP